MADPSAEHWYPTAAYLYMLHLDGPALAWEYLRRHPDYRRDWLPPRRRPEAAARWGLRLLEDPALDARDAHPAWFPDHDAVVQLYPDADPPPDAVAFAFWRLPGQKHLIHDGKRLVLLTRWPGCCLRLVIAPGSTAWLTPMPFAPAPHPADAIRRWRPNWTGRRWRCSASGNSTVAAGPAALLELNTLQALDGTRWRIPARRGRRAIRRRCRCRRLVRRQRLARPRRRLVPGRCADARRLSPPCTASARCTGTRCIPAKRP